MRVTAWLLLLCLSAPVWAQVPDHQALDRILKRYVRPDGVDYAGLRRDERTGLRRYVDSLAGVKPEELSRPDQIAFWLNAYNALILHLVVEGGNPTDSFASVRWPVAGRERTLDDIEHRALRPLAQDPRIHFALVCGAKSCPPLRASAFSGSADLEGMLEHAAAKFINDPRHVRVDVERRKLVLSRLFDWYAEDFGDVQAFVARYRPEVERAALQQGEWDIEYEDYDWSLNEAP